MRAVGGKEASTPRHEPVALIGIGCRFPGADGPHELWEMLCRGIDATREVPRDRFDIDAVYDPRPSTPGKLVTRRGGFLEGIDRFDASFFGISPREAAAMDPQQRLLLEVAWEALEDAGEVPGELVGSATGVYVAMITGDYEHLQARDPESIDIYATTGQSRSVASGRISHAFGFQGPSLTLDTACSSSLVAIHLACRSLRSGESELALAGGVNLILLPEPSLGFSWAEMLSPDGRCQFASAAANGFVRSDGVGLVLLKPLSKALEDGNPIHAVIRGSAVNNDGASSLLMTPSRSGQEAVLRRAYEDAGVPPCSVGYVEAHGTGTRVGDPVEIGALAAVVGQDRPPDRPCVVGSIKGNIGHTEGAAGVAGLIKAALMLRHRMIPKTLHLDELNPAIEWDRLPLVVQDETGSWTPPASGALAGVSSFGISGTNAHVVLEESPGRETLPDGPESGGPREHLLVLSARTEKALRDQVAAWTELLAIGELGANVRDLCYTAARHRSHHEHRLAVVGCSHRELAGRLGSYLEDTAQVGVAAGSIEPDASPRVAFLFPGQGSQWLGMGRELWHAEPVFRRSLERTAEAVDRFTDWSLLDVLIRGGEAEAGELLERVDVIQPALFAVSAALADLWRSWGIQPDAVVGQSMGEVAAALVAGALSLEDATRVICRRSSLVRALSRDGGMAVVALPLEETEAVLSGYGARLSVAVNSSPGSTVVSGDPEAIEELVAELSGRDVFCRPVNVDYASHSPHMDPLREPLLEELDGLAPRAETVPFVSTVTGGPVEGERLGPDYWWSNLRRPVLFARTLARLLEEGRWLFVEISPHPVLTTPVAQTLVQVGAPGSEVFASLRRDDPERSSLLATLGNLYARGRVPDWRALHPRGRCISLPRYPWQRQRFWLKDASDDRRRTSAPAARGAPSHGHPMLIGHTPSPVDSATHFFDVDPGLDRLPYLRGHRVQGAVVLPAAAYVETVLAAAARLGRENGVVLRGFRFDRPLFLEEGENVRLLLVVTREVSGDSRFEFVRREGQGWERLASGTLAEEEPGAPAAAEFPDPDGRGRFPEEIDAERHFRAMERRGIESSGLFRAVQGVRRGRGEAVARVAPVDGSSGHRLHPAVLDGCFQALVEAMPDGDGRGESDTYLPVEIGELRFFESPSGKEELLSHAVTVGAVDLSRNLVEGRLAVATAEGRPILELSGFRFQRLGGRSGRVGTLDDECFYRSVWTQAPETAEPEGVPQEGPWLVLGDRALGPQLAERLGKRGDRVVLVEAGRRFAAPEEGRYTVDPTAPDDFIRLIRAVAGEAPRQVVFLWALDATSVDRLDPQVLEAEQDRLCGGLLHLVQALRGANVEPPSRLWLVTRSAQPVDGERAVEVAQSPLWGLGRVLSSEQPELRTVRIDLDPEAHRSDTEVLLRELLAADPGGYRGDEVAYRAGNRWVHRLVRGLPEEDGAELRRTTRSLGREEAYRLVTTAPGMLDALVPQVMVRRKPGSGRVEIAVEATGVNFMNVLSSLGMYPGYPDGFSTLGTECAGTVAACGPGVEGLRPGDRVLAIARDSMASHVETDARLVAPVPSGLTFAQAATLPIAFTTAHHALVHLGRLASGERVLIHSATGGVGLAALQIALRRGAEVFATAGTEEKRDLLRSLGVREAMDSRSLDFADRVHRVTGGEGVDLVLNSLSGEALAASLSLLAPYGRFLELGKRDIHGGRPLGLEPFRRNLCFFAIDLYRMIAERPALLGAHLREVTGQVERGELEALPFEEAPVGEVVEIFRTMAQARHVGKLVVRQERDGLRAIDRRRPAVRGDGTYLITGGLGALGLAVARRLVERGATSVALLGRSAPSETARREIEALEADGTRVRAVRADVADRRGLARALDEVRASLPPLRGVVHAAGMLEDRLLLHTELESLRRVIAPKVRGSWNLHELTADDPLDWFVLFSSAAVLVGSPGQGSYVAGNEFMDALAHHRRSLGLPGLSIAWGPWSEIGLAADEGRGDRLGERGLASITPAEGVDAFERLLATGSGRMAVMRFDLDRWCHFYPGARNLALLSGLRRSTGGGSAERDRSGNGDGTLRRGELLAMDPADRCEALSSHLARQIASILRLSAATMDLKQPIRRFGLDSLMAVELKNRIEADLGVTIPIVRLLQGITIRDLSDEIVDTVGGGDGPGRPTGGAEEILSRVDALSDDEVDALLEDLAAEGGAVA